MSLRPSCATERCPGDPGRQCKTLFQKEKPKQRDFILNKSRISNWGVYLTVNHSGMAHLPPSRFDLGDGGESPMLRGPEQQHGSVPTISGVLHSVRLSRPSLGEVLR